MRPIEPTLPNILRAVAAFLGIAVLFAACPLAAAFIVFVLILIPIRKA